MRARIIIALGLLAASCGNTTAAGPRFRLEYSSKDHAGPFTGRVYVMLFEAETKRLRGGPDWFHPEPFFAMDVTGWKAGEPLIMG
ncbi:MAG: hypothetical protein ACKO26_05935, partial [Planctomycetota bacterium]